MDDATRNISREVNT